MHPVLYKTHRNTSIHKKTCFLREFFSVQEDFGHGDNHSLTDDVLSVGWLQVGSVSVTPVLLSHLWK